MREPVLDAETLRAVAFGLGDFPWLLATLAASAAQVPPEVFNGDSGLADENGQNLSVLARDLRALARRVDALHWSESQREQAALRHAAKLADYLADGLLIVDPLRPAELLRRESLRTRHGIGRGEAACLVLAERHGTPLIFLSENGRACRAARLEGVDIVAVRILAVA